MPHRSNPHLYGGNHYNQTIKDNTKLIISKSFNSNINHTLKIITLLFIVSLYSTVYLIVISTNFVPEGQRLTRYHQIGSASHKPRCITLSIDFMNHRVLNNLNDSSNLSIEIGPTTIANNETIMNISSQPLNEFKTKVHEIPEHCEPYNNWQIKSFPTCNIMHEIDFSVSIQNKNHPFTLKFQNQGGGHDVWKLSQSSFQNKTVSFVLKTLRWKREYNKKEYEGTRIDSLAMERLHSSSRVMDIYGYCSFIVLTEYANGRTFSSHFKGRKNTPRDKLNYAIDIAQTLVDVHNIDCNTTNCNNISILHNDLDPSNFMISNNQLKINDFNMGRLSYKNKHDNEQCVFQNGFKCGENGQRIDFKSPEECNNDIIQYNDKIDTYSLGSMLYYILTDGVRPYQYKEEDAMDDDDKRNRIVNGVYPILPDDVLNSDDKDIVAVRNAWYECRILDPEQRPSVNEIVRFLTSFIHKQDSNATSIIEGSSAY